MANERLHLPGDGTVTVELKRPWSEVALRLIGLVKAERTIQTLVAAMHLPAGSPKVVPTQPPETAEVDLEWSGTDETTDWPV